MTISKKVAEAAIASRDLGSLLSLRGGEDEPRRDDVCAASCEAARRAAAPARGPPSVAADSWEMKSCRFSLEKPKVLS